MIVIVTEIVIVILALHLATNGKALVEALLQAKDFYLKAIISYEASQTKLALQLAGAACGQ